MDFVIETPGFKPLFSSLLAILLWGIKVSDFYFSHFSDGENNGFVTCLLRCKCDIMESYFASRKCYTNVAIVTVLQKQRGIRTS